MLVKSLQESYLLQFAFLQSYYYLELIHQVTVHQNVLTLEFEHLLHESMQMLQQSIYLSFVDHYNVFVTDLIYLISHYQLTILNLVPKN